ncbi:MAG: hypothetical protein GY726_03895 [Proteobacteria bacterium]|nr:hypothetical protein [Pseudomonadota bacterium]
MKKHLRLGAGVLVGLCAGIVLLWSIFFRPADDVRNVRWGMPKEAVKSRETWDLQVDKENELLYNARLFEEFPAALAYYFEQNSLTQVRFVSFNRYKEFKGCLQEFREIALQISTRRGKPQTLSGEDFRESTWKTDRSTLTLQILTTRDEKYIWMLQYSEKQP